jgi:hypothetical protein
MDSTTNYFVVERANNNSYPLLSWDEPSFRRSEEVVRTTPVRLRLGKPVPKKPQMVDFHVLPEPVVSKKIRDLLVPMNLLDVQLVPAQVTVDARVFDYWILHVRRCIEALDLARSKYEAGTRGEIMIPEKIVLDDRKLEKVPLDERLLFRPKEYGTVWLFHQRLKDAIEAVNPVGLRFFHVRDWDDTVAFQK